MPEAPTLFDVNEYTDQPTLELGIDGSPEQLLGAAAIESTPED